jgi:hypothetical protein
MKMNKIFKGAILAVTLGALLVPVVQLIDSPVSGIRGAAAAFLGIGADDSKNNVDVISNSIDPKDKLITQDEEIAVQRGNEKYTIKLKNYGKNSILVTMKLENGKDIKFLRRVLRMPSFKDVPAGYWAKAEIELSVAAGLINKQKSAYFRPEATLTKENFARTLVKALGVNPVAVAGKVAGDIDVKNGNAKYINYMVNTRKLMDLDANGNFNPGEKMTKGDAIAIFCKLEGIEENWNMTLSPFEDLPPRHKYARYISAAEKAKMLDFALKRGYLDADGLLNNAEMASLMSKTKFGKKAFADLLDWKTGYGVNVDKKNTVALSQ